MYLKRCHECLVRFSGRKGEFCSNSCRMRFKWKRYVPKTKDLEVEKFRRRVSNTVFEAKRKGILVPSEGCEACGIRVPLEAHHEDYSKLLEVRWLCRPCHRKRHVELKKSGEVILGK
jgi:hypothetical protein